MLYANATKITHYLSSATYKIFFNNFKYANIKYKIFQISFYRVVLLTLFIRYQLFVREVTHK